MRALLFNRLSFFWALLIAATMLSAVLGHGIGIENAKLASTAVIVVAFIKARYVILEFMELRHAPLFFRAFAEVWAVLICTLLCVMYW